MCKSLRDKKSSIQFLVLFSKFNFPKMPIKSFENRIFCPLLDIIQRRRDKLIKQMHENVENTEFVSQKLEDRSVLS